MTQSYTNPGGTGDRTGLILVTTTATISAGNINHFINGLQTDQMWIASGQSLREFLFDFSPSGGPRLITEAKWYQNTTTQHGEWKWQGSNDGSTWTDIGVYFTLGGTAQVHTELASNTNFWRYYRLLQIAGVTSSTPFLREIEFNIDDTVPLPEAARLTLLAVEHWNTADPDGRVTQMAIEHWASVVNIVPSYFSARYI